MSDLDLAAIRQRVEKATEGPWDYYVLPQPVGINRATLHSEHGPRETFWTVDLPPEIGAAGTESDAEFIAHAREDIPALLAEVERLRAKLKQLSTLPTVEAKGPNDTDVGRFLIAARNLENGEYIGGSCTRRAVAALIRRDVAFARDGEES